MTGVTYLNLYIMWYTNTEYQYEEGMLTTTKTDSSVLLRLDSVLELVNGKQPKVRIRTTFADASWFDIDRDTFNLILEKIKEDMRDGHPKI